MNERNHKTIAIILAILLLFNSWQLITIRQELADLTLNYNHTLNSIQSEIHNIEQAFDQQYSRIDTMLTEQASLFTKTDISMKLEGNKIAVTMQAIPKELQNNETVIARITADGKIYNQPADADCKATILIDPAKYIQPCFVIQSPSGIRQQILTDYDIYTMDYISGYVHSSWEDTTPDNGDMVLGIYLPDMTEQPFTADKITEVKCIVVNTGEKVRKNGSPEREIAAVPETAAVDMSKPEQILSPELIPEGDEYIAVKQSDSNADELHYQADFLDRYEHRNDYFRYNVYLVLTTADGMQFATTGGKLADFWFHEKNSSSGSYDTTLYPVFE